MPWRYAGAALRCRWGWSGRAIRGRIEPLQRFARNLCETIDGVPAPCVHPPPAPRWGGKANTPHAGGLAVEEHNTKDQTRRPSERSRIGIDETIQIEDAT